MTVIRAEQVQSRGDEETFRNRPEALGNRRAGNTTGEWSAHKLPRRLDWPRWEGPEQGSRNCVGGAAERRSAGRKAGIARGSRLPHPFLWQKGRENPWGSGRTGAWSQSRLPKISQHVSRSLTSSIGLAT